MESSSEKKKTPKMSYSRRSSGGRIRIVVYLETDLALYADRFCQENKQSMSSLFNELVEYLRDEIGKEV